MSKITSILTIMTAVMLAATACTPERPASALGATPEATPAVMPSPAGTQPAPEPTANPPSGPAADGPQTVTLDDQGKTIQMAVGQSFLLKLGEDYEWEVTVSDQSVVSRVKNIAVVRGAQGVYDALHAGTVTLTATGDPACRQSQPPCAAPSRLFTMTIVVK